MENPLVTQGASADDEVLAEHRTYTATGRPDQEVSTIELSRRRDKLHVDVKFLAPNP